MEIHLSESHQSALAELSARSGRSVAALIEEAIDYLLAHQQWFDAQVQIGIDQIARGEFLEEDEMGAQVARMLTA
jgi:predicted transcriptional regulator